MTRGSATATGPAPPHKRESHNRAELRRMPRIRRGGGRDPPTTTSDALVSYIGAATIHLSALDLPLGGSGVAHTYYVLDGEPR